MASTIRNLRNSTVPVIDIPGTLQETFNLGATRNASRLKELWEKICQAYTAALHAKLTVELFPYWVFRNACHDAIPLMIDTVYGRDAQQFEQFKTILRRFSEGPLPRWHFVLFLGPLPQSKVRALHAVTKDVRDVSFDDLFDKLCQIRRGKRGLPKGPLEFTPKEIKELKGFLQNNDTGNINQAINENSPEAISLQTNSERNNNRDTEGDDNREAELSDEDNFLNFQSPVSRIPLDSTDSIADDPNGLVSDQTHGASSVSVSSPGAHALNIQRSDTDDVVNFIAPQLNQSLGRQAVALQMPSAGTPRYSEAMADTAVSGHARVGAQGEATCANDITSHCSDGLHDNCSWIVDTMGQVLARGVKRKRERDTLLREEAETLNDRTTVDRAMIEGLNSGPFLEQPELLREMLEKMITLSKKHKSIRTKLEEIQANDLKLDAIVKEMRTTLEQNWDGIDVTV